MNWHHFHAFLWLRWRLFANQLTRGGIANKIILAILGAGAGMLAIFVLIGSFLIGYLALADASPIVLLLMWDGILLGFVLSWMVGLMVELQRSEAFALDKFMHLPVSLASAFVLNYVSSLACLTTLLFVPIILGLSVGMALSTGPALGLQLPLAAAFVFMTTAITYQFQGWLATLMVNKRRRRTIIVIVTVVFVLIFQVPNLVNIFQPWKDLDEQHKAEEKKVRVELDRKLETKEITPAEHQKKLQEIRREHVEHSQKTLRKLEEWAWIGNVAVPPGWVAIGAASAADGNLLPAVLGIAGLTILGSASLWRAYRTSMRLYTGQFTAGHKPAAAAARIAAPLAGTQTAGLLDQRLPWISEQAAAIALAGFRSLLRAPEVKMLLLSPVIMLVILGGLLWRSGADIPEMVRPLITFGVMATILFTMGQLAGNQFGYDRSGFKVFVLSPAPRREILLGKNLAIAPIVAALTLPLVLLVQIMLPSRLDLMLAMPFQFVTMFLIYCLLANLLSIYAPMPIAAGSMKPASPKLVPFLLHMAFMFALPLAQGPTLVPFGVQAALEAFDWFRMIPIGLLLSILECAAVVAIYRVVLTWEGSLLQSREQKILDTVTAKAE